MRQSPVREIRIPLKFKPLGRFLNMYENQVSVGRDYDSPKQLTPLPIKQQIERRITELEKTLEVQRELLQLLEKNPDIARFMDLSRY